ncbi:MAG: aminotransferase class I/II-fold pyridoxal phosphate-dependent enzyme [Bacteroides sp.]|nr:aminotransferase class I/II-fold pyridoxal phosphate-dependent enzyme [Prevotella sp.]MCM1408687.1 aminotransferase class I/II-fold pyridoxal phosphate-dependent enzyme [Treponema brennaborense]MCM1470548.1 aminotransferase class I/II-fold pyridoxal phosphate-dependent enzyme [Bacteroides sp.]
MFASRLRNLKPYIPGEQPDDKPYIKLNANENPYPPPESVARAVADAAACRREKLGLYPDPDSSELRRSYAALLNNTGGVLNNPQKLPFEITEDMIYCGNGSDEVLSFVFYAFFDGKNGKEPLIVPEFSYSFYPVYAGFYGIPLRKIPLRTDWSLDVPAMLSAAGTNAAPACAGMIFANPNAPSGRALCTEELRDMLRQFPKDRVFVVDEAYADFSQESALPLLAEFENLLVIRTASKSLSLAGMRLGFAAAQSPLIRALTTVKNSVNHFPVDFLAKTAGTAACAEIDYYVRITRKITETRERFCGFLRERGWQYVPSAANFVLVRKIDAAGLAVYEALKKRGVLVRYFDTAGLRDYVRVTIGSDEQMDFLMEEIARL